MFGLKLINDKQLDALKETVNVAQRAIEDMGWINLSSDDGNINNLIAGGFKKMLQRVKLYYYNNPFPPGQAFLTLLASPTNPPNYGFPFFGNGTCSSRNSSIKKTQRLNTGSATSIV